MVVAKIAEKYMILCRVFCSDCDFKPYQKSLPPNLFLLKMLYWIPWNFKHGWKYMFITKYYICLIFFYNVSVRIRYLIVIFKKKKEDVVKNSRKFWTRDFQLCWLFNILRYVQQKCDRKVQAKIMGDFTVDFRGTCVNSV